MRLAIVPASMLAKPPPFQRKRHPQDLYVLGPEDWCGSDAAVGMPVRASACAERTLNNAQARLQRS